MSFLLLLVCSALLTETFGHNHELKGDLVFVHILYRHGDRTPVDPYPTDPWRDLKYWPTGWGQLTNIGKMQHFKLGHWLKDRYSVLLNKTFSTNNLYVHSTDVDRTLMSALSNLAGLFPPIGRDIWDKDIDWQPIPVHTIPEYEDEVLAAKKSCPAYDYAMSKAKQSDEFKKIDERYAWLYRYLTKYTGRTVNSVEGVEKIYDTLHIEDLYNKTLPEWTNKIYPSAEMDWLSAWSFATSTYTRKLARLKTGPLLKEILERFVEKASSKLKPDRSVWIYSAHDVTVANLLNTLKLFEYHSPPYTACIMLEMRLFKGVQYLSVFYKNTTEEPLPLYIPNCGVSCPLPKMFKLYSDVLPEDWEYECKLSILSMTYEDADIGSAMAILFVIASLILLVICIYISYLFYKRKNYNYDYHLYTQIDS